MAKEEREEIQEETQEETQEAFTEEEWRTYLEEAAIEEKYTPFWQSQSVKRFLAALVVVMLCANAVAFLPQVFSLAAVRFLTISAQLSLNEQVQSYKDSVAVVQVDGRKGTGFLISNQGVMITNQHVVEEARFVTVTFPDGGRYEAVVTAIHTEVDLAMLAIGVTDRPFLKLATDHAKLPDIPVYVIGNPLFFNGIANEGVTWNILEEREIGMLAILAPIYKGNSGSPVIRRADGQVIGVIYATTSIEVDREKTKVGIAIPVEQVVSWIEGM